MRGHARHPGQEPTQDSDAVVDGAPASEEVNKTRVGRPSVVVGSGGWTFGGPTHRDETAMNGARER